MIRKMLFKLPLILSVGAALFKDRASLVAGRGDSMTMGRVEQLFTGHSRAAAI